MKYVKVEIKLTEEEYEPYAVIYTREITPAIRNAVMLLEQESPNVISVVDNERIIILQPEEIIMIRVENEKTSVYAKAERYESNKRLYEFEEMLGNGFMKTSKSTIVNLKQIAYVQPTLGGLMLLVLKNGCTDHISRKYWPAFKKHLGL
ncbi:MAG: LytTR family transcriptional regulator [Anaerotignum sp.]|nr:LytTR family transcriptional regulator [Anaerotignum sp.]